MNTNQAVENAMRRSVLIKAGEASASGVILITGCVLTCFHTLRVDNGLKVDNLDAEVICVDPQHDLAILEVPTVECGIVQLANVGLGEQVFTVGNPIGLVSALMFGRVVHLTEQRLVHDMHGAPGISGSGLFSCEGNLVGVNHSVLGQKHVGNWLTCAVPNGQMQKILSKIFSVVQPTAEEIAQYGATDENGA